MTTGTPIDLGLLDAATTEEVAGLVGDDAIVRAMVDVELALLAALAEVAGVPAEEQLPRGDLDVDTATIAAGSRGGGNPVIPLLAAIRPQLDATAADSLHLGATSQDVLDSALMLVASRARAALGPALRHLSDSLASLALRHGATPVAGRTLGQQAAPTTAGLRLAVLLDGVTRARRRLEALELPAQLGGSVGTLAVLVDRFGEADTVRVRRAYAARLGLDPRVGVWHVERTPVADLAAALAILIGALGRVGLEVAQAARTEVDEVALALSGAEGGSSAMPQKRNPVAAVLLVANARRAPGLVSTVLGAQLALDDRPPGDWHAEWQPLRELLRLAVESAALAAGLVDSLDVRPERAAANLDLTRGAVHAERAQAALVPLVGRDRAAELVRTALSADDFVPALLDGLDADAAERVRAVAVLGGPVGLSQRLIEDVVAEADAS